MILPSLDGYMGVQPGHAPLLAGLDVGEISYRIGGEEKVPGDCSGGFAEVLGNAVSILAETAEPAEEIDLERAEQARRTAEQEIKADLAEHDMNRAEVRLKRAVSRIKRSRARALRRAP